MDAGPVTVAFAGIPAQVITTDVCTRRVESSVVEHVELLLLYVSCVSVIAVVVMLEMFALLRTFSPVVLAILPILSDWVVVLFRESVTEVLVSGFVNVSLIVLTDGYIMLWRDSITSAMSSVSVVAPLPGLSV